MGQSATQRLGCGNRVLGDERQCGRADEQLLQAAQACLVGSEPGQGVLVHLVLGTALAERAAERGQSADLHAAVLRHEDGVGAPLSFVVISSTIVTFSARGFSSRYAHLLSLLLGGARIAANTARSERQHDGHTTIRRIFTSAGGTNPLSVTPEGSGPAVYGERPVCQPLG